MKTLKNLTLLNKCYPDYNLGKEYVADDTGKVYKLNDDGEKHEMSPYENRDGYIEYVLTNEDKVKKHIMCQIIVAGLFVNGRTEIKNEVNHKNGKRNDNRKENLEWTSRAGNIQHSYDKLRK